MQMTLLPGKTEDILSCTLPTNINHYDIKNKTFEKEVFTGLDALSFFHPTNSIKAMKAVDNRCCTK